MGVKDLWKVLWPAASTESVTRLAVDGFNTNLHENRGYRIGIDASVWFGHVEKIKNKNKLGKNAALRTLFFRCADMLGAPLLPLFVFDGKNRPLVKRGKAKKFTNSRLLSGMQELLDAFGFQWHCAPGEAEAELAYLNRIGVIDAVWTDDGDVFLFGAVTVIRSPSSTLSSNASSPILNAEGRDDGKHVLVLKASDLASHQEVQLSRGALILIALLRGGDYDEGVPQIGMQIAYGLARCGFGESLLNGAQSLRGSQLIGFLADWRRDIVSELRSDSHGFLHKKHAKLARSFPADFPKLDVLAAYTSPVVSDQKKSLPRPDWGGKLDISALAGVCERTFGWDDATLLQRFRSLIWPGAVMRVLRDEVISIERSGELQDTGRDTAAGPSTSARADQADQAAPSLVASILVGFHGQRKHASTDYLPELRTEINPARFVQLARSGLSSSNNELHVHKPSGSSKSAVAKDTATLRIWLPACIAQLAAPQFVSAHEQGPAKRRSAKRHRDTESPPNGEADVGSRRHKTVRASTSKPPPRSSSASQQANSSVIDLTEADDRDVIVVSDSDDDVAHGGVAGLAGLQGMIIDLT